MSKSIEELALERAIAAEEASSLANVDESNTQDDSTDQSDEPQGKSDDNQEDEPQGKSDDNQEDDEKDGKSWRRLRRRVSEAKKAQRAIVEDYGPVVAALEKAKAGDVEGFFNALEKKGLDTTKLREYVGAPKPPQQAPATPITQQAGYREVHDKFTNVLGDHPVTKLPGGMERLIERVSATFKPHSGAMVDPRKEADAMLAEYREALGVATPAKPSKKTKVKVVEDDSDDTPPKAPTTAKDWEALALKRAVAAEARDRVTKGGR